MPSVKEVRDAIDAIAPFDSAESWDNAGTLVDCGGEVSGILCALDITDDVVNEAEANSCQLIVAHHPVIFHPMKEIAHGGVVYRLVKKGISAICAHTNLDMAPGGVNDILAAIFGIEDAAPFAGVGRAGFLRQPASAAELAAACAKKFGAHVRLADAGRQVYKMAVLGGAGGGLLNEAATAGVDCLLTGEADHHDAIEAKQAGISLILAGHFHTEFPVVPVLSDYLGKRFPAARVLVARRGGDPFVYLNP